jgi:hypothetical protein
MTRRGYPCHSEPQAKNPNRLDIPKPCQSTNEWDSSLRSE